MAKPNYAFAKRQKELAKKQKTQEKLLRKAQAGDKPQEPEEGDVPLADSAVAAVDSEPT